MLVSLVDNFQRLKEMEPVREVMSDIRTVIILPNQKQEIVTLGLSYYPNYLSYNVGDFGDVVAVLRKMINRKKAKYYNHIYK